MYATRPPLPRLLPVRFLIVSHFTNYERVHLMINLPVLIVLLISKLPEMHGVRIFGINRGIVD